MLYIASHSLQFISIISIKFITTPLDLLQERGSLTVKLKKSWK